MTEQAAVQQSPSEPESQPESQSRSSEDQAWVAQRSAEAVETSSRSDQDVRLTNAGLILEDDGDPNDLDAER